MTAFGAGGQAVLDCSRAARVRLPAVPTPDVEAERKPEWYWTRYNRGVSFYDSKSYAKAKEEFLTLLSYESPHNTAYTYLLRTFRKIIEQHLDRGELHEAYAVFREFLSVCAERVTDADRRKFNKMVAELRRQSPEAGYQTIDLAAKKSPPEFELAACHGHSIAPEGDFRTEKGTAPRLLSCRFVDPIGPGRIYVDAGRARPEAEGLTTPVVVKDGSGQVISTLGLDHGVYRFKAAETCDRFIATSGRLVLYLYSLGNGRLASCDLRSYADNEHHTRCVAIAPEGKYALFTCVDAAYLMDDRLQLLASWRTPPEEGYERRVSAEAATPLAKYQDHLKVLGVAGQASHEEIKRAFREAILKHHPDRNPNDPGASQKTRAIIEAYETLTSEDARYAFEGVENGEYYFKLVHRAKIEIPGLPMAITVEMGMVGGLDWIYAACIGRGGERMYLGTYAGKVYCTARDGCVRRAYDCGHTVRSIREKEDYLFIQTDYALYVLKGGSYLTHVGLWQAGSLTWCDDGFMLVAPKDLQLFLDTAAPVARLRLKDPICDAHWADGRLRVLTAKKTYVFSVS